MTALKKFLGPPYKLADLVSLFLTSVVFLTIPIIILGLLEGRSSLTSAVAKECRELAFSIPMVGISSPVEGEHLTGKTAEVVLNTSAPCLTSIQLYVDETLIKAFASAPYTYSLDITNLAPGNHKISARSINSAGISYTTTTTIYRGVKEIVVR